MSDTIDLDLPDHCWKSRAEAAEAECGRLREQLAKVVRPAWLLANWNDHNFSHDDQDRWRAETRGACKAVEDDLPR